MHCINIKLPLSIKYVKPMRQCKDSQSTALWPLCCALWPGQCNSNCAQAYIFAFAERSFSVILGKRDNIVGMYVEGANASHSNNMPRIHRVGGLIHGRCIKPYFCSFYQTGQKQALLRQNSFRRVCTFGTIRRQSTFCSDAFANFKGRDAKLSLQSIEFAHRKNWT